MDIFRFINSRDIREHLQEIEYQFTAPEAAYLVEQSQTATLQEKISAWQWIIENMKTTSLDKRLKLWAIADFHQFLQEYINLQEQYALQIQTPDGGTYVCGNLTDSWPQRNWRLGPYNNFDDCVIAGIRQAVKEWNTEFYVEKSKASTQNPDECEICMVNLQGEIKRVNGLFNNTYEEDLFFAFDEMRFEFPTPFQPGDIVCHDGGKPFVLTKIFAWEDDLIQTRNMTCCGYTLARVCDSVDSFCIHTIFPNYLDLEYYREPLAGVNQLLQSISNFLKGKEDLDFLLNTYLFFYQRAQQESQLDWLNWCYSKERLEEIGVDSQDKEDVPV